MAHTSFRGQCRPRSEKNKTPRLRRFKSRKHRYPLIKILQLPLLLHIHHPLTLLGLDTAHLLMRPLCLVRTRSSDDSIASARVRILLSMVWVRVNGFGRLLQVPVDTVTYLLLLVVVGVLLADRGEYVLFVAGYGRGVDGALEVLGCRVVSHWIKDLFIAGVGAAGVAAVVGFGVTERGGGALRAGCFDDPVGSVT